MLHDNIEDYERRFTAKNITVDKEALKTSRRCGKAVCDFIRDHLRIDILPHEDRQTVVSVVDNAKDAAVLHADSDVVKLFYDSHLKYNCYSQNWGASKGLDHFKDVCVVMNRSSWQSLQGGTLHNLAAMTRNKLYVACSRASGNLFLVPDNLYKGYRTSS